MIWFSENSFYNKKIQMICSISKKYHFEFNETIATRESKNV